MVLSNFKENLKKYAHLLVNKQGINNQPGHTVALTIAVEQAELVAPGGRSLCPGSCGGHGDLDG